MARTVTIKEIWKVRQSEIPELEGLTRSQIFRDYEKIFSLFELEYLSEGYSSVRKFLTKINTADGHTLYVAHTKYIAICSDSLLAEGIESRLGKYEACTNCDITKLAGEKISVTNIAWKRNIETGELEESKRTMEFQLPRKKRGVHIIFFDDMDA